MRRVPRPSFLPPPSRPPLPHAPQAPTQRRAARMEVLHIQFGGASIALPAGLVHHIHPAPALTVTGRLVGGLLGFATLEGGAVPVLDLGQMLGTDGADAVFLVELRHDGRRLAVPAQRVTAGPGDGALFARWLATPEAAPLLNLAPLATSPSSPQPVAVRHLVIFSAGGLRASLPVEDVVGAIPPVMPVPTPANAIAEHLGDVLPVRDGGLALGGSGVVWPAPLLRLRTQPPILLAVEAIAGVRAVPVAAVHPVPGRPVAALATVGAEALPVVAAAALVHPS